MAEKIVRPILTYADEAHHSSANIPEGNELFYTKAVAWNDSDP